jgi:hypothetical protein
VIIKRFVLATSLMMFVAMSGQAYAGSAVQNAVQRSEDADSAETPRGIEATGQSYQDGPKITWAMAGRLTEPRQHNTSINVLQLRTSHQKLT